MMHVAFILLSKYCENDSVRRTLHRRFCDAAVWCRFDGTAASALTLNSDPRSDSSCQKHRGRTGVAYRDLPAKSVQPVRGECRGTLWERCSGQRFDLQFGGNLHRQSPRPLRVLEVVRLRSAIRPQFGHVGHVHRRTFDRQVGKFLDGVLLHFVSFHGLSKSAGGGTRTRTGLSPQGILSPLCLPFHHAGFSRWILRATLRGRQGAVEVPPHYGPRSRKGEIARRATQHWRT